MLIFVACIGLAGVVLSFVARYPAVLIAMAALVGATFLSVGQGWSLVPGSASLPLTILLEIVAIQVGYALGVLVRAALEAWRIHARAATSRVAPAPNPEIEAGRRNGA